MEHMFLVVNFFFLWVLFFRLRKIYSFPKLGNLDILGRRNYNNSAYKSAYTIMCLSNTVFTKLLKVPEEPDSVDYHWKH